MAARTSNSAMAPKGSERRDEYGGYPSPVWSGATATCPSPHTKTARSATASRNNHVLRPFGISLHLHEAGRESFYRLAIDGVAAVPSALEDRDVSCEHGREFRSRARPALHFTAIIEPALPSPDGNHAALAEVVEAREIEGAEREPAIALRKPFLGERPPGAFGKLISRQRFVGQIDRRRRSRHGRGLHDRRGPTEKQDCRSHRQGHNQDDQQFEHTARNGCVLAADVRARFLPEPIANRLDDQIPQVRSQVVRTAHPAHPASLRILTRGTWNTPGELAAMDHFADGAIQFTCVDGGRRRIGDPWLRRRGRRGRD